MEGIRGVSEDNMTSSAAMISVDWACVVVEGGDEEDGASTALDSTRIKVGEKDVVDGVANTVAGTPTEELTAVWEIDPADVDGGATAVRWLATEASRMTRLSALLELREENRFLKRSRFLFVVTCSDIVPKYCRRLE